MKIRNSIQITWWRAAKAYNKTKNSEICRKLRDIYLALLTQAAESSKTEKLKNISENSKIRENIF